MNLNATKFSFVRSSAAEPSPVAKVLVMRRYSCGYFPLLAGAVLAFLFVAATRCAHAQAPTDCPRHRDFCAAIERYAKRLRLPGYALAIARDGHIVHLQTQGYANREAGRSIRPDSIFPVASITKTFTAVLMMRYAEQGRIRLDDYMADYPQFDDAVVWPYNSADIRLRHVLSHTSEGATPGSVFTYNGNRYNDVYGIFAQLSGEKDYARAFASEVRKGILEPLRLEDTLPGFPEAADDAHIRRIVTPYRYDTGQHTFVADDDLRTAHRHAYPNSGILSTLSDLVRYADALDRGSVIGTASVAEMTVPFRLNRGAASPYGLGWYSEERNGVRMNWAYGLGPSYSSFLLHLPSERLTFVFLANNDAPTASVQLHYGNALQFPPAALFLRNFSAAGKTLPALDLDAKPEALGKRIARLPNAERQAAIAQAIGIASTTHYAERTYGDDPGRALALTSMLRRVDPQYFRTLHPELVSLITNLADASLVEAMNDLASAYAEAGYLDPRISQDLGNFYARVGLDAPSMTHRAALAAAPGFETNDAAIAAAFDLGDQYFRKGDVAAGRKWYWIGVRDATRAGWGTAFADAKREHMNELTRSAR